MDPTDITAFLAASRTCALGMLSNAEFVERELVHLPLANSIRATIHESCQSLIGTKHDVFSEIVELDELMASATIDNAKVIVRIERIARWLAEEIAKTDPVIRLVRSAAERDPSIASASILVSESMANVIREFQTLHATANAVLIDSKSWPLPDEP